MKRLGICSSGLVLLIACGGDVIATDTRQGDGSGGAGSRAGAGGNATAGQATGGNSAGAGGDGTAGSAGGSGGSGGLGGAPSSSSTVTVLATRPGRPRALALDGDVLRWVLGAAVDTFVGPVESFPLTTASVETTLPADPPTAFFSSLPSEPYVYASGWIGTGGIRRIPKAGGLVETVFVDPEPSFDLLVDKGLVYRIQGGQHGESWLERVELASGGVERVSVTTELDAYVGDLHYDGTDLFWSIEAYGGESGLYRASFGTTAQTYVAPGNADAFSLVGAEIVRVRRDGETSGNGYLAEALPKTGGSPRKLFTLTANALAAPASFATRLYFLSRATEDGPWRLLDGSLAGGEPRELLAALCPPDKWLPSLVAGPTALYVACPAEGTIKAVVPSP
jgi:hypothetical protein